MTLEYPGNLMEPARVPPFEAVWQGAYYAA